jgi:molybdopterin-containing oxidoreductase family iron-sulfur binding subunit
MPWATGALGLLVESHMGRPTKIEGNPDHPASLGATDVFAQAEVLSLYDPHRSQVVRHRGRISTFGELLDAIRPELDRQRAVAGAGLRVLTTTVTSPALAAELRRLLEVYPRARWHQWEPVNRDLARAGALLAFGTDVVPRPRFDRAEVVLSLDADFLSGPAGVVSTRELAQARRARRESASVARLYVAESSVSITGARADHRLPASPAELRSLARAVARALGHPGPPADLPSEHRRWAEAVASDLGAHRGASLVVAGSDQPPEVHALAHAMNQVLGNVGTTVVYGEPPELEPVDQGASIRALAAEMAAGAVDVLAILGGNPVYDAPVDFARALERVGFRLHLALHEDETSELCHWHVPAAHFLESWGDERAFDGTASIVQPLIALLHGGRTALEIAAVLRGEIAATSHDLVRAHWRDRLGEGPFEEAWRRALHDGLIAGTALPPRSVSATWPAVSEPADPPDRVPAFLFRPDPSAWDGRYAGNGWLQECPRPLTKLTWDNAVLVAPADAAELGLDPGQVAELRIGDAVFRVPVLVVPGHARGCVTLPLGYGRSRAGPVGSGVGFDACEIARRAAEGGERSLRATPARHAFAITQHHHRMEGRDLVRVVEPAELRAPRAGETADQHHVSLYPGFPNEGRAWGMVIDLNACTGCNACVVACQAENNVPVVGRGEVLRGREMHWLRVDHYLEGDLDAPAARFQPVPCMHCENAPCEVVCPVGATAHSGEGLNEMTYNRCVGTRYCANNCPYKVRRFNFFHYSAASAESLALASNPDVTVRARGVMEKCTYCVQRIQAARIEAKREDRPIRDGEVRTACQAACPARAIAFGDLNDPGSEVARLREEPHHYGLLAELNTKPRTTYLADVRAGAGPGAPGGGG